MSIMLPQYESHPIQPLTCMYGQHSISLSSPISLHISSNHHSPWIPEAGFLCMSDTDSESESQALGHEPKDNDVGFLIDAALAALVDECGIRRFLTHSTLRRIAAVIKTGHPNALMMKGIEKYEFITEPFKYFHEAESKGCCHPLLYYYLGECYRIGDPETDEDFDKSFAYYCKAIDCGFFFAHVGIFDLYCLSYTCDDDEGSMGRSIAYLKGLEMTGVVDPDIFYLLGSTYYNKTDDALIVETYSQWAIEKGLIRSFIGKGLPELLKAEERGLCHASIYASIISVLIKQQETSTSTDDLVQVRFKQYGTRGGLALHYCEKLISMGSPIGYYWKGEIHYNGLADVVKDCSIAVKTWLEADEQGLATTIMYDQGLADAFSRGLGVAKDGAKVLEYCLKGLEVANTHKDQVAIYERLASLYDNGLPPIEKDLEKSILYGDMADRLKLGRRR